MAKSGRVSAHTQPPLVERYATPGIRARANLGVPSVRYFRFRDMRAVNIAIVALTLAVTAAQPRAQTYRAVDLDALARAAEASITDRIDAERKRLTPGAPRLAADSTLQAIAQERSFDMANGAPFAHENSEGQFAIAAKVRARFGPYGTMGENIMMERDPARAFDAESFARRAVQGWMNSEGHRANILSNAYDRSGVGVAIRGDYIYATRVFWGPPRRANAKASRGP